MLLWWPHCIDLSPIPQARLFLGVACPVKHPIYGSQMLPWMLQSYHK